jgi:predicted transcriptional regulator
MPYANNDTRFKGARTTLDFVYGIAHIAINPSTKTDIYSNINCNRNTFNRVFYLSLDHNIIMDSGKVRHKTSHLYIITDKGRDYIIAYDIMMNVINKMNIMLNRN